MLVPLSFMLDIVCSNRFNNMFVFLIVMAAEMVAAARSEDKGKPEKLR